MRRTVARYVKAFRSTENDAKDSLENVLALLSVAKRDFRQLQKIASKTGNSRHVFETSLWQRLVDIYDAKPNALNECLPLKNVDCFDNIDIGDPTKTFVDLVSIS